TEVRTKETIGGLETVIGEGKRQQVRVPVANEPPAGAQDPGGLRDPAIRITPDDRAVLTYRKVERTVGERGSFRISMDEGERDAELSLEAQSIGELASGVVQPDRPGAAARE